MVINVVGLGYIGLPTAAILADHGFTIVGTDVNPNVINRLKDDDVRVEESELQDLIARSRLKNITFCEKCVRADVYIIAVPTPFLRITKKIDSSYLVDAILDVVDIAPPNAIIAIESTVSPGTIDKDIRPIMPKCKNLHIAHVPERIVPGKTIKELTENNRTIGVDDIETAQILKKIYSSFCMGEITITNVKTAEMTKVVENAFRDVNIAFANELAKICASANLDVHEVIKIANMHPRVNILSPGPGVGGHCISVDPWFLVGDYPGLANIILTARKINDSMPEFVLEKVSVVMEKYNIHNLNRVGFYGLTYKENVDDIRESPTIQLISCMKNHLASGAIFFDPLITDHIVDNQETNFEEFLYKIDLLVVMVGHDHLIKNQHMIQDKVILDTRNVLHEVVAEKI